MGTCYQRPSWVAGGQCPVTRAGSGHTPQRPLQRGLSQAPAVPVQQNRQMATSVPLWPPAPGGAGQCGPGCGAAWPGALDTPAVAQPVAASGLRHGHPHLLSVGDTTVTEWHVGNSGLRTGVGLCQPMLTPGQPFLPEPGHSEAQKTGQTAKGSTSASHGLWCKERGRHFQPQLHRCTLGQRLAMESPLPRP